MEIKRNGSQPSAKGPADWFTGTVRIDPLFQPNEARRAAGALVTFEPGARTAWHTHPLGQNPDRHRGMRPGYSAKVAPSRKSGLATSCGFHRARSTGTALRPPPP